jgi:hypothetical protein
VLNQRKRVGRLRLLLAALVVTSISVAGAVGTASATPEPKTRPEPGHGHGKGVLEICKAVAGNDMFSGTGTVGFKVQGVDGVIQVDVGYCSMPIKLNPGPVTVTEIQRPGYSVDSVTAVGPTGDNRLLGLNPGKDTATVRIDTGGVANQTMVTFTNKVIPKGYLEICKEKHRQNDRLAGYVSFTVSQEGNQPPSQTVSVRVGACSMPIKLNPGPATITEVANSGADLVDIKVEPEDRLETPEDMILKDRSVTVTIVPGDRSTQTIVTFINKKVIPPPTKGWVKICKRAGHGVHDGTPFKFDVGGKTVEVLAGECSARQTVPFGELTVTEQAAPWTKVSQIDVDPPRAAREVNLAEGWVKVDVKADRVVTEVEFTNKATPPGSLKICKVAGRGVVPGTLFTFTVGNKPPVKVPAGACLPMSMQAGEVEITETPTTGLKVTDIEVVGAGGLIDWKLETGKALVYVPSGQVTEVLYTNSKKHGSGDDCVHPWPWFKQNPKHGKGLAPKGGLNVGGDRLTAKQMQAIHNKAARGGNLRFELEAELIAAQLNQLRGASTPASVQSAVNASQFLLSQSDGAVRRNGALTTTKLNWWNKVKYKGKAYQAGNLTGAVGSYNEGEFKGGPHPCGKPEKDRQHEHGDYSSSSRYVRPI